jgi:integrase
MTRKLIEDAIPRLRQRQRADGTWRLWWEPETAVRAMGFEPVELDAGKVTWSVREAGKLNGEVEKARAAGGRIIPKAGGRTMSALIAEYQRSEMFRRLAPKTQTDYRGRMLVIDRKWGPHLVQSFSKPVMREWYETLHRASGEWQAVAQLRIMSLLFSYAELKGWRAEDSNPCRRLKMSLPQGRDRVAGWAEYDALIAAAEDLGWPVMACAIALAAMQGQRQTDIREARVDAFQEATIDGRKMLVWRFRRSKRKNLGIMPVHPDAVGRVRALLAAAVPGQELLLIDSATGRPLSESLFQDRWTAVRDRAAKTVPTVATLQFRDLRRTFGVWSRAGGAGKDDVGNVLGNSAANNPRLEEIYMPPSFSTTSRAIGAVKRPVAKDRKAG